MEKSINGIKSKLAALLGSYPHAFEEIIYRWTEPHRHYHNIQHLDDILSLICRDRNRYHTRDNICMALAALFHDAVYEPLSKTNEEASADLMRQFCSKAYSASDIDFVEKMILHTKDHTQPADDWIIARFLDYDINGLLYGDVGSLLSAERRIFKEFQMVPYPIYIRHRTEFMTKMSEYLKDRGAALAAQVVPVITAWKPRVAIYPGSFNPLHIGHMSVLEAAERLFDKVIIGVGVNPDKKEKPADISGQLPYRQVMNFVSIREIVEIVRLEYDNVAIVRGLRPRDFNYEWTQEWYTHELCGDVPVLYLTTQYPHVSSSAIRTLRAVPDPIAHELADRLTKI